LEPIRNRTGGASVARVRLLDGPTTGEQAVLRARAWATQTRETPTTTTDTAPNASSPGRPSGVASAGVQVGDIVFVRGRVAPLGFADAYQRKRNAHAAILAQRVEATGERRGGLAGALDSVRRRAEAGLDRGLNPPEAALLRGMVLGEDERLTEEVREDFQRSGLAHILAVSGSNVMLLAVLVLGVCGLLGVPLRARLLVAAALI